ncbi:hypothetical protein [Clostridium fungisolvens]|uniref:Uncharacterized protein n=1 Tax=Clostridium fungisolvens TaxID=1604897 RepID=A0A6V8SN27_9CLOT|nr:hypothetical protein [Clostridium fungisolvens]GFP76578.1 hypothetical protein bsdtw1_02681 [Clostridium fungisolvens]
MGYLGLSNLILLLATGFIVYFAWNYFKNVIRQRKVSVPTHVFLLGIVPLLSLFLMYIVITTSSLDFFGYILLILFTSCLFISVWIFIGFNGEYKKVEMSMNIVFGAIMIISMMLMGLTEILPNDILEFCLRPLISMGSRYDIWSRPPYQLAHFVTFVFSFPYIASFIFGRIILNFRKYKGLMNTAIQ